MADGRIIHGSAPCRVQDKDKPPLDHSGTPKFFEQYGNPVARWSGGSTAFRYYVQSSLGMPTKSERGAALPSTPLDVALNLTS